MSTPNTINAPYAPLALGAVVRYRLRTACARIGARRIAIALGLAAAATGITFSWGWLTAIGVAPVLVAVAPCAAMCAVGLCMPGICGGSPCPGDFRDAGDASGSRPHRKFDL